MGFRGLILSFFLVFTLPALGFNSLCTSALSQSFALQAFFGGFHTTNYRVSKVHGGDKNLYRELISAPEINAMDGVPLTVEDADLFLENIFESYHAEEMPEALEIAIRDWETDILIGTICLHSPKPDGSYYVGYRILTRYWGKGIVSEVFPVFIKHVFQTLPIPKLRATALVQNIPSNRILQKNGFRFARKQPARFTQGTDNYYILARPPLLQIMR